MTKTSTAAAATPTTSTTSGDASTTIDTLCGHKATDDDAVSTACGDYTCSDDKCLYAHLETCRACTNAVVAAIDLY
jgi:hypothetical protein